jgi:hypothetical protein
LNEASAASEVSSAPVHTAEHRRAVGASAPTAEPKPRRLPAHPGAAPTFAGAIPMSASTPATS